MNLLLVQAFKKTSNCSRKGNRAIFDVHVNIPVTPPPIPHAIIREHLGTPSPKRVHVIYGRPLVVDRGRQRNGGLGSM